MVICHGKIKKKEEEEEEKKTKNKKQKTNQTRNCLMYQSKTDIACCDVI